MSQKRKDFLIVCGIAAGVFVLATVVSILVTPHHDVVFYRRWGNKILDNGTSGFYNIVDNSYLGEQTDYPPIYLLISAFIIWISRLMGASLRVENFLFRLPSIIALVASVYIFYYLIKSFNLSRKKILIITAIFAFCPAFYFIAIGGQIDCMLLPCFLLSLLFFYKDKYFLAIIMCVLGLLIKLQFVIFLPLLLFAIVYNMYKRKQLRKCVGYFVACVSIYIAFYMPFIHKEILEGRLLYFFELITDPLIRRSQNDNLPSWFQPVNLVIILGIVVGTIILFIKKTEKANSLFIFIFSILLLFIWLSITGYRLRYVLPVISIMLIITHIVNSKKLIVINYCIYILQSVNSVFSAFTLYKTYTILTLMIKIMSLTLFALFAFEMIRLYLKKGTNKEKNLADNSVISS